MSSPIVPSAGELKIGTPNYTNPVTLKTYVGATTPLTVSTNSTDSSVGFQYRFVPDSGSLPTFVSTLPFPLHWQWTNFSTGPRTDVPLLGFSGDGGYDIQYSAVSAGCGDPLFCGLTEPRHSTHLVLDTTPPAITIFQPQATTYPHSAVLTLNYSVIDAASGVKQFTPSIDGFTTLAGHGLQSGQAINLLTELALGPHTFSITATDNVSNTRTSTVTFTIIVTPDSIKDDVRQFLQSGAIKNHGTANSLLAKLDAAAAARARGQCSTAANIYQAFINELQAQSGEHVDAAAAAIMTADAQYLIAHCP